MSSLRYKRRVSHAIEGLSEEALKEVVGYTWRAFGASNWNARSGAEKKPYYFNLDLAIADGWTRKVDDEPHTAAFMDHLAGFIKQVAAIDEYQRRLGGQSPVLGYVCPDGGPTGIIQLRGLLNDRLPWPSVQITPDSRLVRSRVVGAGQGEAFPQSIQWPESIQWLYGRDVLLLTDATTTGASLAEAKGALNSFGCGVLAAIAVFDRDEGAVESLESVDIPFYPLYSASQFADLLQKNPANSELAEKVRTSIANKQVRDLSYAMSRCL